MSYHLPVRFSAVFKVTCTIYCTMFVSLFVCLYDNVFRKKKTETIKYDHLYSNDCVR